VGKSKDVCSIYKYTVVMLYAEGREGRDVVNGKRKEKGVCSKSDFRRLMRIKFINHVKTARKNREED